MNIMHRSSTGNLFCVVIPTIMAVVLGSCLASGNGGFAVVADFFLATLIMAATICVVAFFACGKHTEIQINKEITLFTGCLLIVTSICLVVESFFF